MGKFAKIGIFLVIAFSAVTSQATVWDATNEWNSEWESKYSHWIQDSFHENFFISGPWGGIPTDCADAVYFSRIIFAYENSLPFRMADPTGGKNYISNLMSRWNKITDQKERVKKFLTYVADLAGTSHLADDTYPVSITRENVIPGRVWVRPSLRVSSGNLLVRLKELLSGKSSSVQPGHAEVVKKVAESGNVFLIGSTVPADIRKMVVASSFKLLPTSQRLGLMAWKQPKDYETKVSELPGYSLEQYKIGSNGEGKKRTYKKWSSEVHQRLALRDETQEEKVQRLSEEFCAFVESRAEVIDSTEKYKTTMKTKCMNASEYDAFSTPSRDQRIYESLDDITKIFSDGLTLNARIENETVKSILSKCEPIKINDEVTLGLYQYAKNIAKKKISSDPNVSVLARWGLSNEKSNCKAY